MSLTLPRDFSWNHSLFQQNNFDRVTQAEQRQIPRQFLFCRSGTKKRWWRNIVSGFKRCKHFWAQLMNGKVNPLTLLLQAFLSTTGFWPNGAVTGLCKWWWNVFKWSFILQRQVRLSASSAKLTSNVGVSYRSVAKSCEDKSQIFVSCSTLIRADKNITTSQQENLTFADQFQVLRSLILHFRTRCWPCEWHW